MKGIPSRFSLNAEFEQPDYVPADFDLLFDRDGRTQEVSNCWTYPSIFSFETDLIRKGLADQNIRGNEWSLSTLHTNGLRGFKVEVDSDPISSEDYYSFAEAGQWGGFHWYGLEYFATGQSGTINLTSSRDINRINNLLSGKLSGKNPSNRWYINQNLADSNLMPDPDEERLYGYDQAKIALSNEGVKKILSNDRIAGFLSYAISDAEKLGFFSYLDTDSGSQGEKGEWFQPASFAFRDQEGSRYSLNDLLEAFKQDNDPPSAQWNTLMKTLARGAEDGGGHAVTVVGWDDNFKPSTVNKISDFFDAYVDKFDQESDQNLWLEFSNYLDGRGVEFSNRGDQPKGAWVIQNSWGNSSKQIVRQYLPYNMADLSIKGDPQNFNSIVADGVMFHYADASRSFGDVHSASTAVPLSDFFDYQFIEGRGVGFQFQSSGTPVVAIGSILMPDPDEAGLFSDPNSNDLTDGSYVQAKLWDADQLLEQGFGKVDPLAETQRFSSFYGYQTLEFDTPVEVEKGENIIATFEYYEDSSGPSSLDSQGRFLSYAIDRSEMDKVIGINNSGYTPSDPEFYETFPIPLVKPRSSEEIKDQTYFAISANNANSAPALKDIGLLGEVVHLNVIHQKQQPFEDAFSNESDSFNVLDDSKKGQVSIGFSDNRDLYQTPSRKLRETFFINSANNKISSGGMRDVFMMTESSGKSNQFDSGAGADTLILSLGPKNSFKGRLQLENAEDDRLIIRGQSKLKSRLRSDKGRHFYDIQYPGARIHAYVENKNSVLNVETDFATDVTELLEIGV